MKTVNVGDVLDPNDVVCREFNPNEVHQIIKSEFYIPMSWGYVNPSVVIKNKCFRFEVSGHHHKGFVYIVLNFMDYFDVYYTNKKNVVKKIQTDVFVGDLVEILDNDIERIPEYKD